ncbi:MAG: alpha/beta hydrolase [Chitinophagaceae bacterium]|nr:MAG: alpha/beta hydrolase [Chitinophagaceae bacterium]
MASRILTATLFVLLFSCKKDVEPTPRDNSERIETDVAYGSDLKQKLDLYLPAGRSADTTRVIVLIHGGGWVDGDKADFTPAVTVLRQQFPSYAIFNINYRLASAGNNLFPAQENDVQSAISYIYTRREELQVSGNFVYIGASAGAHLALLQGYKHREMVSPTAIVDLFGPTDFKSLYDSGPLAAVLISQLLGATPAANPGVYEQSSPLFFATAGVAPTLILQGGKDDVVPPAQSEMLKARLDNAGIPNQYVLYPDEGHGWDGAELVDTFAKIGAFLRLHR